jgi:PPOX class probable F420-dependent enzyme
MPAPPVPSSVASFLSEPHFAVVGTLRADGAPHTAVTWYDWDDGRILLNMDHTRVRLSHLRRDARLSLTVVDREDPYRHVTLVGVVDALYDDDGLADIDRLAVRYTSRPYRKRESPRVSAWVTVDHWHGWDTSGKSPEFVTG